MRVLIAPLSGNKVPLEVDQSDTVASVKKKYFALEGIPVEQQDLNFDGKSVLNDSTLSACGITDESILRLRIIFNKNPPEVKSPVNEAVLLFISMVFRLALTRQ